MGRVCSTAITAKIIDHIDRTDHRLLHRTQRSSIIASTAISSIATIIDFIDRTDHGMYRPQRLIASTARIINCTDRNDHRSYRSSTALSATK
jgi:hypothetical protein